MKIYNITLAFQNKVVLRDIDLEVESWEFVFMIWYSWSWKTSLIRSIIWDFKPFKGDIILDNNMSVYKNSSEKILDEYRRNIWVIFQDYKLMESKKVYENVAFAMEVCWYKDDIIRKRVPEVLTQVWLLVKKDKFVQELSGWEKTSHPNYWRRPGCIGNAGCLFPRTRIWCLNCKLGRRWCWNMSS